MRLIVRSITHRLVARTGGFRSRLFVVAAEDSLDSCHELLGIEGLLHIIVGAHLKTQNFVEDLAFSGEHDDRRVLAGSDLAADLVAVHARKHEVEQDQVGLEALYGGNCRLAVSYDLGLVAFLHQIETDELSDIGIVVDDQDFLSGSSHRYCPPVSKYRFSVRCYCSSTIVTPASPSPKSPSLYFLIHFCLRR